MVHKLYRGLTCGSPARRIVRFDEVARDEAAGKVNDVSWRAGIMGVTCTQIDNFAIAATSGHHAIVGDEPLEFGGGDLGFNPFALLMASLGN